MKKSNVFYAAVLGSLLLSCKHDDGEVSEVSAAQQAPGYVDALLIQSDLVLAEGKCRNPLINLMSNSFTDGILRNGATSNLGMENPVGKKMKERGLYYQLLSIGSIIDHEFTDGIANPQTTPCLPKQVGFHLGTFSKQYIDAAPKVFSDDQAQITEASKILKKNVDLLQIASIAVTEDPKVWPESSKMPKDFQVALQKGTQSKLESGRNFRQADSVEKLQGIAAAFSPLYVSMSATFDRKNSKAYMEAYLPPMVEIENLSQKTDDWTVKQGLKRIPLEKPVDIKIAKMTDIGYLQDPSSADLPIIKAQMFKDWKDPNRVKARIFFGKLTSEGPEKGALSIDFRDYRNAFYVGMQPEISIKDNDLEIVKKVKRDLNATISVYRIDARVHRLGIDLVRTPPKPESWASDLDFRPKFSMKNSDISFRLHHMVDDATDLNFLKFLKFTCVKTGEKVDDCYRDFGVYTELRDFFLTGQSEPQEKNLLTRIAKKFRDVVNNIIAINVKFVIDWNMGTIEEAIDDQLPDIIGNILKRQAEMQDVTKARLERELLEATK